MAFGDRTFDFSSPEIFYSFREKKNFYPPDSSNCVIIKNEGGDEGEKKQKNLHFQERFIYS